MPELTNRLRECSTHTEVKLSLSFRLSVPLCLCGQFGL